MCGIAGYVGNKQVVPVIVDEAHRLDIRRAEGKLRNLAESVTVE